MNSIIELIIGHCQGFEALKVEPQKDINMDVDESYLYLNDKRFEASMRKNGTVEIWVNNDFAVLSFAEVEALLKWVQDRQPADRDDANLVIAYANARQPLPAGEYHLPHELRSTVSPADRECKHEWRAYVGNHGGQIRGGTRACLKCGHKEDT